MDIIEPMLTILPPPAVFIAGYAACEQRYALVRLVSSTWRHSASDTSCGGFRMLVPALFTRTSSRPKASSVALTMRRTARSEEHTSELQSHHDLVCRPLL